MRAADPPSAARAVGDWLAEVTQEFGPCRFMAWPSSERPKLSSRPMEESLHMCKKSYAMPFVLNQEGENPPKAVAGADHVDTLGARSQIMRSEGRSRSYWSVFGSRQ